MKLQSKKNKKLPIIIVGVVVALVVLFMIVNLVVALFDKEVESNPQDIEQISLSSLPSKTTYYVGEQFDATGAKIQVGTYDMTYTHFVDHNSLTFGGFDSSIPVEEQVITVSYQGFTTTFTVTIKEIPTQQPDVETIEVNNFETTYTMAQWNNNGPNIMGATVTIINADGTVRGEPQLLQNEWISGYKKVSAPCKLDITIQYNYAGTLLSKTITITITN